MTQATDDHRPEALGRDITHQGDCVSGHIHLAEFVEKAAPVATKVAVGTGATTAGATALWTLPEIASAVGITCSLIATASAVTFQYLNYRLNKQRASAN